MVFTDGLVSIIMSNYNTPEEYLRIAIESILNQTYTSFEFIIIDDCSTDNSLEVIRSYNDDRIVILQNDENLGLTKSLNRGLEIARGEYVARMDADDVCFPDRLEKQVRYMEEHPDIIVCGSGMELIGDWEGKFSNKCICRTIPDRETFRIYLLFGNHINIPNNVAMFRHKKLTENNIKYNEKYIYAQDFRMWVECSQYGECQNLSDVLVQYRIHNNAVSVAKKETQKNCAKNIMAEQLGWLDLTIPDNWENIHWGLLKERKPYDSECKKWMKRIIEKNKIHKVYNQKKLKKLLFEKWAEISYFALRKEKNPVKSIKILLNIPIKYWGQLWIIRQNRKKKEW